MICGDCCKNIKLKCLFYLQIITSNIICKKKEPMMHTCTTPPTYDSSIIDSEEDYGHYYDTEFDRFNNEKPKTQELDIYDDAYEEYLDRYEHAMNYEDFQLNLIYQKENSIFNKIMEKGIIIYIFQYIYNLCNFHN